MNCEQAAEFVSALFDGERIPSEAAAHIGGCAVCGARMRDYAMMAAEVRRASCDLSLQQIPEGQWKAAKPAVANWMRNWRETMRIPRFAFAVMLIAIVSLAVGIAIVRANGSQRWFRYQVRTPAGGTIESGLVEANPKGNIPDPGPVFSLVTPDGVLVNIVRVLDAKGGAERLGVRALWLPPSVTRNEAIKQVQSTSETEIWIVSGQEIKFPVAGYGDLTITGQLIDKLPDENNPQEQGLYPKQGQFRVMSPQILLRDGRLISSGGGEGRDMTIDGSYFAYFVPRDGWYLIAFSDFPGAHEGVINDNRVEFKLDGKSYELIAPAPIVPPGNTKIWARHIAGNTLVESTPPFGIYDEDSGPSTAFGDIKALREHLPTE
jgi:hypothetical protein